MIQIISNHLYGFEYPRKHPFQIILFLFITLHLCTIPACSQSLTDEQIYEKVANSMLEIRGFDQNDNLSSQGVGVIINNEGYLLTNYHNLSGNKRLEILRDNKIIPYTAIVGIYVMNDILILKIESREFSAIKIGNPYKLKSGQKIFIIDFSPESKNHISEGVINSVKRYKSFGKDFMQIKSNASQEINSGMIINENGDLLGISTLPKKEQHNLIYFTPIDEVLSIKVHSYSKNDVYKNFKNLLRGKDAIEKSNYNEAIKSLTNFTKEYPDYAEAYYTLGNVRGTLEDYKGAIQDFSRALEVDSNYAEAFNNRGSVKDLINDHKGAIQDFSKAIEINPNYAEAFNSRGITKGMINDHKGAIQDFSKAIEINPNYSEAFCNRGLVKDFLNDHKGAIQDFTKAIEINPNDAEAFNKRGLSRGLLDDNKGAIKDFTRAIEINPNDAVAFCNRGAAKTGSSDYAGAIQDFTRAIEINPNNAEAFYNRGIAKIAFDGYTGAIRDLTKAIEIEPNYAEAFYFRGLAKLNLGDKYHACLDWNKASRLGYQRASDLVRKYCK